MTRMIIYLISIMLGLAFKADAQTCEETLTHHARLISGEVSGEHAYQDTLSEELRFALERNPFGWSVRVYGPSGIDLTQITPPYHLDVNPRDIEGWHFRNADNTAVNDGSINAPQEKREFIFSLGLEGTAGFKPPKNEPLALESSPADGRGWLTLLDYGLSDLKQNEKARLVYLKFDACLAWPKSKDAILKQTNVMSGNYLPEEQEQMAVCGLKPPYRLVAYVKPRMLVGDIDGDGALDTIAPIVRSFDGRYGIAICRAGTRLDILGMKEKIGTKLPSSYLKQVEAWSIQPKDSNLGTGDTLAVERVEKSRYSIYWSKNKYHSQMDYQYVEP